MRTSQLFSQDCNQAFTALYSTRFETIRAVAAKRTPTLKPHFTNPMAKNPKHAAVLAENGINYDQPLSPVKLAAQRAERIAREKQKNQVAAAVSGLFLVVVLVRGLVQQSFLYAEFCVFG